MGSNMFVLSGILEKRKLFDQIKRINSMFSLELNQIVFIYFPIV